MKIVFAVSEVEDLVKTGGLADVGKCLPLALNQQGHDVKIIMPLYKCIADTETLSAACPPQVLNFGGQSVSFQVKQLFLHGITVYLIDCPDYFQRDGIYSDGYEAFADNGQRFAFFSAAVVHGLSNLGYIPDVLHCNDWHTSLIPYFLRHDDNPDIVAEFAPTRSILTIHNAAFQGVYPLHSVPILQYQPQAQRFNRDGYINFLQTGLECSDFNTTVSPNYATELLTDLGSHGLSGILQRRAERLVGILNGCDYSQWDPASDQYIEHHFTAQKLAGKTACKNALQQYAKLPELSKTPLIGMVCRLTEQKGFGYILPILEQLLKHKVQLVIIGSGDPVVVEQLTTISKNFSSNFAFINGFSNRYAHLVEAGADFFLMPSQFEPCGLNQMYSLAYATIPIVRSVGGLKDTVVDLDSDPERATGFSFSAPQSSELLHCVRRALLCYHEDQETFKQLRQRAMQTRFTWDAAATEYYALYQRLVDE